MDNNELLRQIAIDRERARAWAWIMLGSFMLGGMLSLLLVFAHLRWDYVLLPTAILGMAGFLWCLVVAWRHIAASFRVDLPDTENIVK